MDQSNEQLQEKKENLEREIRNIQYEFSELLNENDSLTNQNMKKVASLFLWTYLILAGWNNREKGKKIAGTPKQK